MDRRHAIVAEESRASRSTTLTNDSLPAMYRTADARSAKSQRAFFRALQVHIFSLVITAGVAAFGTQTRPIAVVQFVSLVLALGAALYLSIARPDRSWYAARALAESVKTSTWRFACRAEPFDGTLPEARSNFQRTLSKLFEQHRRILTAPDAHLGERQLTADVLALRDKPLETRIAAYSLDRIEDQLRWYRKKSVLNQRRARAFFVGLVAANAIAVLVAAARIAAPETPFWPTDMLVAVAAGVLSWIEGKRYSELTASYTLAAHEIGLLREEASRSFNELTFSRFVGDAENAFSREHTQWVARKDS